MGVCCAAHLKDKIDEYIAAAKDHVVTVGLCVENATKAYEVEQKTVAKCDYCNAKPRYWVAYHSA